MKKQVFLITGASGYIGGHITEVLDGLGISVICLMNKSRPDSRCNIRKVNWESEQSVRELFMGVTHVFHVAGTAHQKQCREYSKKDDHDLLFTKLLVDAAIAHKIRKFYYVSSISVYGESSDSLSDNSKLEPSSFYGVSKLNCESLVRSLSNYNILYAIYRLPMVYGKCAPGSPNILLKLIKRYVPIPVGAFTQPRTFVDINKIKSEIGIDVEANLNYSFITILADDDDLSLEELCRKLGVFAGKKVFTFYFPKWLLKLLAQIVRKERYYELLNRKVVVLHSTKNRKITACLTTDRNA